jgi:cobalt-zinc-cadmium efflux system membrane fusion protein
MVVRTDNTTNLFTISDLKDVWVQANVYEANIEKVHPGDSAEVRILSEPNKVFKGKVDKILNVLDPTSKVIRVRIVLQNPDYILKPQMYAGVIVKNAEKGGSVLCVPSKALVYENSRYYLMVYHGKGNADIAPVEILSTLGSVTYLSSGVNEGDRVIGSMSLQIYSELNN